MSKLAIISGLLAAAAAQSASDFNGYINYTTVTGYFLQDLASTNTTGFDYTAVNFGLINQTYQGIDATGLTQWQAFEQLVDSLNANSPIDTAFKVFWFGRHGEGYHNAAESFYGTPAWNCYWSELNGNATATWADADLTPNGIKQAQIANAFWKSEIANQKIPHPQSYYTSPLTRCLRTANLTFSDIPTPEYYPFIPQVKEFFREGISVHTCDRRSNKTYIHNRFPTYTFEAGFAENDELWNANYAETSSAQDIRSKSALDSVFKENDHTWISITSHSGEIASLLRVLGHRSFSLSTGAIIPVLVKAQFLPAANAPAVSSAPARTSSAFCTNGPPVTSISTLAQGCVCSGTASSGLASSTSRPSSATGSFSSSRVASASIVSSKPVITGTSIRQSSAGSSKTSVCSRASKSRGISASATGKTAGTSTRAKTCKRSSSGPSSGVSTHLSSRSASLSASRSASTVSPSVSATPSSKGAITSSITVSSSKAGASVVGTSTSSKATLASSSTRTKVCKRSSSKLSSGVSSRGPSASSSISTSKPTSSLTSSVTASKSSSSSVVIVSSSTTHTSSNVVVTSTSTATSSKVTDLSSHITSSSKTVVTSSGKILSSSSSSTLTSKTVDVSSTTGTSSKASGATTNTSSSNAPGKSTSTTSLTSSTGSTSHITPVSETLPLSTSTKTKACKSKTTSLGASGRGKSCKSKSNSHLSWPSYVPKYGDHGHDGHEHDWAHGPA